ncbi:MAG: DUF1565 domain-containing protein [Acidobacteria bacterium]|nr:DUF1565 domain-containing protein [Acidobacteriota bacterium]
MKKRITVILAVACWLAHAAETGLGGPYVVKVSPRAATVVRIARTAELKLGLEPNLLAGLAPALRAEKVTLRGLKPGTPYYYEVAGSEEGKGRFKTPPEGSAPFRFVVLGATRTRHDVHARVAEAIGKVEADFVVHTGDMVEDGADPAQWPVFFSIQRELLRKAAFFPVPGDHERLAPLFYDFFDLCAPYYSFDWGGAHFIMFNTDIINVATTAEARVAFWLEQLRWMEQDLANSQKAAFRFVVMHHPPFTAVRPRQHEDWLAKAMAPLFEKYRVSAVFSGHDHNYQRHFKDGVHYIVTGGGGAPLEAADAPVPGVTYKAESIEHYVQVRVTGEKAWLEAVDLNGRLLDGVELTGTTLPGGVPVLPRAAIWVDVTSRHASEDGSEIFPFKSISKALGALHPPAMLRVKPGEYRENIVLGDGFTLVGEGLPVLRAADRTKPVVVMRGKTALENFRVTGGDDGIIVGVNTEVRILNCEILDNTDDGIGFERSETPGDTPATVHIENCLVSGNSDGIDLEGTRGVVRQNRLIKNRDDGLDYDGDTDCDALDNEIRDNRDDGIEIRLNRKTLARIEGNIITGNGEDGIEIINTPVAGVTENLVQILRNTLRGNVRYGIGGVDQQTEEVKEGLVIQGVLLKDNIVEGNGKGQIAGTFRP